LRLEPGAGGGLPNLVGGTNNSDAGWESVILAGRWNTIQTNVYSALIGGGWYNSIQSNAIYSVIGPGYNNSIQTNAQGAVIGGGMHNAIKPDAQLAVIGGGYANTNGGSFAVVPGGYYNAALGTNSFAAGRRAKANHNGTWVWADYQNADFASTASNQFLIRATNGVGINTNNPQAALHVVGDVIASNFLGSAAGLTNLNGAAFAAGSIPPGALGPGAIDPASIDDHGSSVYESRMQLAGSMTRVEPLPFEALSLVVSGGGPAPAFTFNLAGADFGTVVAFTGHEGISEPYEYVVEVLAPRPDLIPDEQMSRQASLRFARNGRTTPFDGLVTGCSVAASDGGTALYTFRLESQLAYLALSTDYRIYQGQIVPDVVADLYHQVTSDRLVRSLTNSYHPREYVVQFAETDLSFFSRLLEDQGIFYFFGEESLIPTLGDTRSAYLVAPNSPFRYYGNTATNMPSGAEFVRTFQKSARESTMRSTIRSYNFKTPATDLTGTRTSATGRGDRYEFGSPGTTKSENDAIARVRVERYELERATISGAGNAPDLRPGHTFGLEDRTDTGLAGEYVVTAIRHAGFRRVTNGVATLYYGNRFEVIPATMPYRPALKTPKPVAQASTAKVTGPPGEEIHADKYGRVKVQFHWDRYGASDDTSSAWIRPTSPWAGQGWGAMFLPRVGHEVLVEFLEGNPDQPVITGSLYNDANMPPYALPANKTRSTIQTRSSPGGGSGQGNEIRFEDQSGSEELYLHAQKDLNIVAGNDLSLAIGGNTSFGTANNLAIEVGNALAITAPKLTLSASQGIGIGTANDPAIALNVNGVVAASIFQGSGVALTSLRAAALTGTISDARLSGNVARTNQTWLLTGNAGTLNGAHFLGNTDNQPLELKVNNTRGLRLEPNTNGAPNVIGGSPLNLVGPGVVGATVGGGGAVNWASFSFTNQVLWDFGTVSGGYANTVRDGRAGTVAGGTENTSASAYSAVGGGLLNTAGGYASVIPGGMSNVTGGFYSLAAGYRAKALANGTFVWADSQTADFASTGANQFLIRASGNVGINKNDPATALDVNGTITATGLVLSGDARLNDQDVFLRAGADFNHGLGWYGYSKTFGGVNVDGPVLYGCAGGGLGTMCGSPTLALAWNNAGNVIVDPHGANAGSFTPGLTFGPSSQEAIASRRTAGGNQFGLDFYTWGTNRMSLTQSGRVGIGTVAPVKALDVVDGTGAVGAGGNLHIGSATANADEKLIHFGDLQAGGLGYVYLGERGQDDTLELHASRFYFSAGYVGIGVANPTNTLQVAGNIYATGTITPNSDRNLKTDFATVDPTAVLDKVAALPIQQWRFQAESEDVKHVGPMAQDFQAAFGLGAIPTAIATVDADGVALAAIQGLNSKVEVGMQSAEVRLRKVEAENAELKQRLERLERLLTEKGTAEW
jgi:type VI secretion system secreted protein VgrG